MPSFVGWWWGVGAGREDRWNYSKWMPGCSQVAVHVQHIHIKKEHARMPKKLLFTPKTADTHQSSDPQESPNTITIIYTFSYQMQQKVRGKTISQASAADFVFGSYFYQ